MRNARTFIIGLIGASLVLFLCVAPSSAGTTQDRVETTLAKLDKWLGKSKNAQNWRKYLLMTELNEQIAKGDEADSEVISQVLAKYTRDHKGLKRPHFIAVRGALEAWIVELKYANIEDLPAAVAEAKGNFSPLDEKAVEIERARLLANMKKLKAYLTKFKRFDSWKKYLDWEKLDTELAAEGGGDIKVLQEIGGKYRGDHVGLELPTFIAVRESLLRYMTTAYFQSNEQLGQVYEKQIDLLAESLTEYLKQPNTDNASNVGRLIGWLKSAHQADELVQGIQHHLTQPNLYAHVSQNLISQGVDRKVSDTRRVSTSVGGARVSGNAVTNADVTAHTKPNGARAEIALQLDGSMRSKTTARQGNVTVYARGLTSVQAQKIIYIDSTGIHSKPADAKCNTRTTITGLNAPPLIEGAAWNRVNSSKRSGERSASRSAERQFEAQLNKQAGEMLAKANKKYNDSFRNPLIRRRALPKSIRFSSTDSGFTMKAVQGNDFQVAASSAPPEIPGNLDVALQIHQSILGNLSESAIGGDTITGDFVAGMAEQLNGELPKELEATDWSIKFSTVQPVSIEFGKGTFRVAIRGSRFSSGDAVIKRSLEFSATYKVEKTPNGSKYVRQGDVEARYLKGGKESPREIAVKTVIRKKFSAMFKESVESDGLNLPGKWAELGKLHLKHLECNDGWMSLGWNLVKVRTAEKPTAE